ncbi:MAG: hypothetical protein WDA28_12780 [Castellaniella sp.]
MSTAIPLATSAASLLLRPLPTITRPPTSPLHGRLFGPLRPPPHICFMRQAIWAFDLPTILAALPLRHSYRWEEATAHWIDHILFSRAFLSQSQIFKHRFSNGNFALVCRSKQRFVKTAFIFFIIATRRAASESFLRPRNGLHQTVRKSAAKNKLSRTVSDNFFDFPNSQWERIFPSLYDLRRPN